LRIEKKFINKATASASLSWWVVIDKSMTTAKRCLIRKLIMDTSEDSQFLLNKLQVLTNTYDILQKIDGYVETKLKLLNMITQTVDKLESSLCTNKHQLKDSNNKQNNSNTANFGSYNF
jgi:hypothetical protein